MKLVPLSLICLKIVLLFSTNESTSFAKGKELFQLCTSCHGLDGGGNQKLEAPAIAGLPSWYLESQILKFKNGVRGTHAKDIAGMRMRPMAKTLTSESSIKLVSEYVSKLPQVNKPLVVKGSPLKGEKNYQVCITCHGKEGKGNEALKAPPLNSQSDWYLVSQLKNFKQGVRGAIPAKDPFGAQMPPMANLLKDDQAIKDVVFYIKAFQ